MIGIAAHRGGAYLWPENSRIAFAETAKLPVEQVEFDVHLSRDHKVVVIHDAMLDRTTDGKGAVGSFDWAELRRFVLKGAAGERILLLEEVVEIFRPTSIDLRIELKPMAGRQRNVALPPAVIEVLANTKMLDRSVLTSFQLDSVKDAVALGRTAGHAWIVSADLQTDVGFERVLDVAKRAAVPMLTINNSRLDADVLSQIRSAKLSVSSSGGNDVETVDRLFRLGVDMFTTDRPDLALARRAELVNGASPAVN
jgi:glycerophosphoryl diester phosphodiesterase